MIKNIHQEFQRYSIFISMIAKRFSHGMCANFSEITVPSVQRWFDFSDRLCFFISKKYLSDRDWKSEYCDFLKNTIRANESYFGPGTNFKNSIKLYEEWNKA